MRGTVARGIVIALAVAAGFVGGGCIVPPSPPHDDSTELEGPTRVVVRGSPVVLEEGQVEEGNLVVVGGTARIDGTVRGSLLVFGGRLDVGPHARVEKDLVAVGNEHQEVASAAQVGGSEVTAKVPGVASLMASAFIVWDNLLLTVLVGLATLGLLGLAIWRWVVRGYEDERFHESVAQRPVRAGLIGFGLHVAFWGLGLAAVLSGWLAGAGLAVWFVGCAAWFAGWVLSGVHVGRWLARRQGWRGSPAGHALAGIGVWLLLTLIPVVGWIAAMLGSMVALGSLVSPRGGVPVAPLPAPVADPEPATAC